MKIKKITVEYDDGTKIAFKGYGYPSRIVEQRGRVEVPGRHGELLYEPGDRSLVIVVGPPPVLELVKELESTIERVL